MIAPPRPGVKYTSAEMAAMREAYPDFTMTGYVIRLENGVFEFVHWTQASGGGALNEDGSYAMPARAYEVTPNEPLVAPPIKKRTPEQRLSSLSQRWYEDCMKAGTVPGLSDEKVSELVGRSWKRGQPFTAEDVRAFAASMLADAERKYEASEHKRVVRTSPTD